MPRDSIIFLCTLIFMGLSWNLVNCQEEESSPYDLNQGVLYKQFLEDLFAKYDPENKQFLNQEGYKELLEKMFISEDEEPETKTLLYQIVQEFAALKSNQISIDDINDDLKEQRLLKFMSSKFQIKSDL